MKGCTFAALFCITEFDGTVLAQCLILFRQKHLRNE